MKTDRPIVLFDGVCNLCNHSVRFIIKRDRKNQFLFASLQGKTGQEILEKYNLPADEFNSFILLEDDNVYIRSTGALRIARRLGRGWKFLYGFIIVPKLIRDGVYNILARNRYKWFGKKDECMIPAPELKERFLE
ncbi:MAG TPA: thiol-disulfide oxidoreductase DCC family protein [Chitinophagaceae bacterium]|nr:thiol-disulfide oxidoreductase DCC family protein [Chitinophagaceae bacterium]